MPLDSDDLIAITDHCVGTLAGLVDRDWQTPAAGLDWTCRETLEHLCGLSYAPMLALRATTIPKLAFAVHPDFPIDWLLVTMRTTAVIVAEVARAAPADARAFHPAGTADASGFVAMMADELVLHTHDIASAFDAPYRPDGFSTRRILGRLFPWWPRDADPWLALQWANGRIALEGHLALGESWLWHSAPLTEWDGTIPKWDPVTRAKMTY